MGFFEPSVMGGGGGGGSFSFRFLYEILKIQQLILKDMFRKESLTYKQNFKRSVFNDFCRTVSKESLLMGQDAAVGRGWFNLLLVCTYITL